ncbi:hypothetical protein [Roseibacillus persicicus]|uniref:hypothetical protein n=1 Tax=Roseibacillus persicicus TaxID=454148 RepID=UPI00280D1459|nr:hypothetical protein [Roseibacillus persicicus]MDQ8192451.1 hypothetical protein [Roseibacillus persicicus]
MMNCKAAADKFDCSVHTIKSWARKGEVESKQEGERQPYFINVKSLEQKLKSSPSVKSIFQTNQEDPPPRPESDSAKAESTAEAQEQPKASKEAPPAAKSESPRRKKPQENSPRKSPNSPHRERPKSYHKPNLRRVIDQAKRLPLGDKVRLKNEMGRLIDAV